jgi:membrane-bound ClpP family serine protease
MPENNPIPKMSYNLDQFKHDMPSLILAGGYLLLLGLVSLGVGIVLDVYNASILIWLGTLAITLHLAWAGTGAIALAMVWVLIVLWIAVLIYATPKETQLKPPAWAVSLMRLWVQGALYSVLLGFASRPLERLQLSRTQVFFTLLILTWSGLGLGTLIYP